jgi:hypothetical protein
MEILNHLFGGLGRILLWLSSALVLEELTLGGLAKLLLTQISDSRARRERTKTNHAASTASEPPSTVPSNKTQGEAPCSQSNTY